MSIAASPVIRDSDMIMTVSKRMAGLFVQHYGLHASKVPLDILSAPTQLVWHNRFCRQPSNEWMRNVAIKVCAKL